MNHYPRHVGDIISATVGLSLMERGAYSALLDQYYLTERPLPLDRREVYRMAACTSAAERKAVDYVIARYFVEQPDGFHQKRCDEELQLYRERSASASASASVRWSKRNANAMQTHSEGNANHKPVTSNQEPEVKHIARKRATPALKTPLPEGFAISPRVEAWAAEKGHTRLAERFEHFVGRARQAGYRYADWDEAFMTAIREDWAKLPAVGVSSLSAVGQKTANALSQWIERDGDVVNG